MHNSKIKKKIITLIGPTACNKTSTAVHLIKKFPISIIGVDSVQIYKRFNIGSAKPPKEILEKYKHHLVDSADPENIFSVKDFYDQAYRIVIQAHSNNRIPLLVGGTMMYFNTLFNNGLNNLPASDSDTSILIEKDFKEHGLMYLHKKLEELDPEIAKNIKPSDKQRIFRFLNICIKYNIKPSSFIYDKPKNNKFNFLKICINEESRDSLIKRINMRVLDMYKAGLIDETKEVMEKFGDDILPLNSIGYADAKDHLLGYTPLNDAIEKTKIATRQFAKRQNTWLKHMNGLLIHNNKDSDRIISRINAFMED